MIFEKIYFLIKQKFCKHRFRKHFDTHKREYICKCVKCGKTMTYDSKGYCYGQIGGRNENQRKYPDEP